jgi:hypothetical protein
MKITTLKRMYRARVLTTETPPDIEPVNVTSVTGFHITYINRFGKEQRTALSSENERFCEGIKEAEAFILKVLSERIDVAKQRLDARIKHLWEWEQQAKRK